MWCQYIGGSEESALQTSVVHRNALVITSERIDPLKHFLKQGIKCKVAKLDQIKSSFNSEHRSIAPP